MSDPAMEISFSFTIAPQGPSSTPMAREQAQAATLGVLFMLWANVELVMEMHVKRMLAISTEQACIVCGPLGGGAKLSLLSSLAAINGEIQPLLEAIRDFQGKLGRNALAHGFTTFVQRDQPWVIVSRDVKNSLTVKHRTLVQYYNEDFMPAFDRVMRESGITDQELHDYGLEIARLQPTP